MITLELDLQESYAFRVDCDYSRVRLQESYANILLVWTEQQEHARLVLLVVHVCAVCQPAAARGCPRYLLHRPTRLIVSCYCSPMTISYVHYVAGPLRSFGIVSAAWDSLVSGPPTLTLVLGRWSIQKH